MMMTGYELLSVLLPSGLLVGFAAKKDRKHILLYIALAVYIFAVFSVTGAGTLYDLLRMGMEIGNHNFIPFAESLNSETYRLNILLFLPLGLMLPLIWPKTGKILPMLLIGFGFSLLIEISQMFNHRATDVDDLIMNTVGALVGCLLYKLFALITKWQPSRPDHPMYEPILYIAIGFLGRFLLFNEMGLARLLFGF